MYLPLHANFRCMSTSICLSTCYTQFVFHHCSTYSYLHVTHKQTYQAFLEFTSLGLRLLFTKKKINLSVWYDSWTAWKTSNRKYNNIWHLLFIYLGVKFHVWPPVVLQYYRAHSHLEEESTCTGPRFFFNVLYTSCKRITFSVHCRSWKFWVNKFSSYKFLYRILFIAVDQWRKLNNVWKSFVDHLLKHFPFFSHFCR